MGCGASVAQKSTLKAPDKSFKPAASLGLLLEWLLLGWWDGPLCDPSHMGS